MEMNPIAAVTSEDPYTYYDRLVAERPFAYDESLRCWVAAGAGSLEEALTHPGLRVRPIAEPVPAAMLGTAVGALFSQMVRMSDGAAHALRRTVVHALVDAFDAAHIEPYALGVEATPEALMFAYPSRAVAAMLGLEHGVIPGIEVHASALARAIGPGATAADIDRADAALPVLEAMFAPRYRDPETRANAIAFLFQGYDSVAGAIGHALDPRADPRERSIHNTRRFAAQDVEIAGKRVESEASVLVVLASAPRYAFGTGPHACVAAQIVPQIVDAAVRFARANVDLAGLVRAGFQPLQNARIPVFA
jgi:hypothetical protein